VDLATLLGILGGFGIILAAILFGSDTSPIIFLNIPSILIVVLGTFLVVLIKFTLDQFINAFKVASRAFVTRNESAEMLHAKIVEVADLARKKGTLALEGVQIANPFLARGVQMMVDGQAPEVIREILSKEMLQTIDRHKWGAKVFSAMADVAPAMGMIGTLIGLVQMLSNMEDPKSIGPAMAVALLTTLYGAVLANMMAMPIADKLTLRKAEEGRLKAMCIDGIQAIQSGHNARIVNSLLRVYLKPTRSKGEGKKARKPDKPEATRKAAA